MQSRRENRESSSELAPRTQTPDREHVEDLQDGGGYNIAEQEDEQGEQQEQGEEGGEEVDLYGISPAQSPRPGSPFNERSSIADDGEATRGR